MPEGVGYIRNSSIFPREPQESRMRAEKASFSAEDPSGKIRGANKGEGTEVLLGKRPSKDKSDLTYESLRPRRRDTV